MPLFALAGAEVFAFVLWLDVGRDSWPYLDQWDLFVSRKAGDLGDLFRPFNGHWITLPVLTYRFLYWSFGLRTYLPYRLVVLLTYLGVSVLLFAVMRRAGIHPWIATCATSLFALFGTGYNNILTPLQMSFDGSLAFGLIHLLFADHDGSFQKRDWLGLLAGAFALMSSGVGPAMVAAVGVAVALRRGWRLALCHVMPLAALYLMWLAVIGLKNNRVNHFGTGGIASLVVTTLQHTFRALGPAAWFGWILLFVLFAGAWCAYRMRRTAAAPPVALLIGAGVFLVLAASAGRQRVPPHYVSVVAALVLPALAVAADAIVRRWRWFLPAAMTIFLLGIPHNIEIGSKRARAPRRGVDSTRHALLAIASDPLMRQVPRSLRPEHVGAAQVTVGWLIDAMSQHRLPSIALTDRDRAVNAFRVSFLQDHGPVPRRKCQPLRRSIVVKLRRGSVIDLQGAVLVVPTATVHPLVRPPLLFVPADDLVSYGNRVRVLRDTGPVRISPQQSPFGTLQKRDSAVCLAVMRAHAS